jgi:hypothetical protein
MITLAPASYNKLEFLTASTSFTLQEFLIFFFSFLPKNVRQTKLPVTVLKAGLHLLYASD